MLELLFIDAPLILLLILVFIILPMEIVDLWPLRKQKPKLPFTSKPTPIPSIVCVTAYLIFFTLLAIFI